jgi:alpha-amylase/alpha-mannosidase (GH57 family)
MQRYLCIHGHFYQPPRENPWLEAIEVQDSAYPYHDWNERVTAECYAPNAASRILDGEHRIERIVNNYARISFNFGPTLLAWLEEKRPEVYRSILAADALSRERFSGHGSALAQAYNHIILPLANRRDKQTQIRWGLADFARRFGREAEGMWLPETAVDLETLDLLAASGVRFVVLEPHQARRVRPKGARAREEWKEVGGGRIDPSVPYEVRLKEGRRIAVFFFDGAISRAVAFEGLLISGERFADRLMSAVPADPEHDRLVSIATDGETYGHHHRYGEMALSYALHHIETNGLARLTNYGEYLAAHPPEHEVEIVENTAWSCVHGVDRWREDCGCHTGGAAGWTQAWRAPLRQALDWLRDELAPLWERAARELFADPWAARDGYIEVILDRSAATVAAFLARFAGSPPAGAGRVRALQLLELQRHAMLMYTSCGWFFNDLTGIETVQILRYAGRVAQLAGELLGSEVEPELLRRLARAESNLAEAGTGRDLYERIVRPSVVGLPQVAAHYAVSALFEDYPNPAAIYCYAVEREDGRTFRAGRTRLAIGRARVVSGLTGETGTYVFGVLHFGDHNLNAGVVPAGDREAYAALIAAAGSAFEHGDLPRVIRLFDRYFGGVAYSLRSLFRDEQRRVLDRVLASTLAEVEAELRQVYEQQAPLMRFLKTLGTPLPRAFAAAAEFVLNAELRRAVSTPEADPEEVRRLLAETATLGVDLDRKALSYALEQVLAALVESLREHPEDPERLRRADEAVALAGSAPFEVDLWRAQNLCYELLRTAYPEQLRRAAGGEAAAVAWVGRFGMLAERLAVRVAPARPAGPAPPPQAGG